MAGNNVTMSSGAYSNNAFTANELPIDISSKIYTAYASLTPLLTLTSKAADEKTKQSVFYGYEENQFPRTITVSAASTVVGGVINTNEYTFVRTHQVWYNERTDQNLLITATTIDATLEADFGHGDSAAADLIAGDTLIRILDAQPEGAAVPTAEHVLDEEIYNYTQEFFKSTKHSKRELSTETRFGDKRVRDNNKMFYAYKIDMELAMYLGDRSKAIRTGGTYYTYSFGGINWRLRNGSNTFDCRDYPLTRHKLDRVVADWYSGRPQTSRLLMVMSPVAKTSFKAQYEKFIQMSPMQKKWGFMVDQIESHFMIDIVAAPLLGMIGMDHTAFLLDTTMLHFKWKQRPMLTLNAVKDGGAYEIDTLYGEAGFLMNVESAHGMITNMAV